MRISVEIKQSWTDILSPYLAVCYLKPYLPIPLHQDILGIMSSRLRPLNAFTKESFETLELMLWLRWRQVPISLKYPELETLNAAKYYCKAFIDSELIGDS